jgi:hypothetical protein
MTAPTPPIAVYLFVFGVLLCGVSAFRINVRILRILGAWQRNRKPDPINDFITGVLERIELRNTIGLEVAGFTVGLGMVAVAIHFFKPA